MIFFKKVHISASMILCVFLVFLLFNSFYNLNYQFTHGIEERSLFFGPQFGISANNGTSENPQIAVEGNNVYVVWQDNTPGNYDIFFTHSSDNGSSFAPVSTLSKNNGTSENPQIAVEGNNVYVVWQDNTPGNSDILFKRSPNNGDRFRGVNLKNTNGTSENPQIAVGGNNVYVVWQDNTPGNYDIILQRILSNGTKFKERNLSNNNGTSEMPQISVSNLNSYIIWQDNTEGGYKIFFKHAQKNNATGKTDFGPSYSLNDSGDSAQPKIAGSEIKYGVWITYLDKKAKSVLEFYPFMLFDDRSGDSIPLTRLSSNKSLSNPELAVSGNNAFIVWESAAAGNKDIFFKKVSAKSF
jgi:hypothetical protein